MKPLAWSSVFALFMVGCDSDDFGELDFATSDAAPVADFASSPDLAVAPSARVRVAALSPDKPPLDLCIAPHGTGAYTGPLLKNGGLPSGLTYGKVSQYLVLPTGSLDYRLVLSSVGTCAPSMLPDFTTVAPLVAGQSYTLGVIGFITPPAGNTNNATVRLYTDDATANVTSVVLRAIHASPDTGAVDFGKGSGASFTAIFANVTFPSFGTSVPLQSDANGYITVAAAGSAPTFSVRANGSENDLVVAALAVAPPAGTIATLFLAGDSTGTPQPLKVIACLDNAAPTNGLSSCLALP